MRAFSDIRLKEKSTTDRRNVTLLIRASNNNDCKRVCVNLKEERDNNRVDIENLLYSKDYIFN